MTVAIFLMIENIFLQRHTVFGKIGQHPESLVLYFLSEAQPVCLYPRKAVLLAAGSGCPAGHGTPPPYCLLGSLISL